MGGQDIPAGGASGSQDCRHERGCKCHDHDLEEVSGSQAFDVRKCHDHDFPVCVPGLA